MAAIRDSEGKGDRKEDRVINRGYDHVILIMCVYGNVMKLHKDFSVTQLKFN